MWYFGGYSKGAKEGNPLCRHPSPALRSLCGLVLSCDEAAFPVYIWGNPPGQSGRNSHQRPNHNHPLKSMFSKTLHFWQHKMIWYLSIGSNKKIKEVVYLILHFLNQMPVCLCNDQDHWDIKFPLATTVNYPT